MNECTRFEAMLEARISGEIEPAAGEALRAHGEGCESCRSLLALHHDLLRLGAGVPEPSEAALDAVTGRLPLAAPPRPRARLRHLASLAAGLLLFVAGLLLGRGFPSVDRGHGDAGERQRLVAAMSAEAASNRGLSDVEDSRFTYSNVSLRSAGGGRVDLDFDVTTHVRLVEPVGSELVHEVLVQALLDRSSTGARLQALSYAGGTLAPKVREALIFSLGSDPILAVRLKALELLSRHLDQPDVQEALFTTLREDESVPMRLQALEALAAHRVDRDRIREVIHEGERPGHEAVLVRLAQL